MGRVLVDAFSVVCCAVLLLYEVLPPAVLQGGTVVHRPPSPDRLLARQPSLGRRRSPVVITVGRPLAALVTRPHSLPRSLARRRSIARRRSRHHYYHVPPILYYTRYVYTTCNTMSTLKSQCMHPQPSKNIELPDPAVRCCVVLRCDFVGTYSSTRYDAKYQVQPLWTYVRVVYSSFCFLRSVDCHLSPPKCVSPPP